MASYREKFQDPRWFQFRAEALEYHNYTCRRCRRYESQVILHVHHPAYRWNAEPWDYDVDEVQLLCEDCHARHHGHPAPSDDDVPF